MAAQWQLLTDHLQGAGARVVLTWAELDSIVGGLPPSAVDHYPHWWRGDRPNTRAWHGAGYEAVDIDLGVTVTFVRTGAQSSEAMTRRPSRGIVDGDTIEPISALSGIDPSRCLVVIPCSKAKRRGGQTGTPAIAAVTWKSRVAGCFQILSRMLMSPWSCRRGSGTTVTCTGPPLRYWRSWPQPIGCSF